MIWNFRGQDVEKRLSDPFKQFLWRLCPPSLLMKERIPNIRWNIPEYARAFDEANVAEETSISAELVAQRKRAVDEWNAWRLRVAQGIAEMRPPAERASSGLAAHNENAEEEDKEDKEEIDMWIDKLIEQFEQVVESNY